MSSSILDEVLQEVKAIREKVEKVEEIVEERLIGIEEPSPDEVRTIRGYLKARDKGEIRLTPLEDVEQRTQSLAAPHSPS